MLVNFRVENFKSFKDLTEFSMESTKLKNLKDSNTFDINNISLLKSAVIYGANASGKSNFLKAMIRMRQIILNSTNIQQMKNYPHDAFLLNSSTKDKGTMYEMEFIIDTVLYRYGFEIDKNATIIEEWLYHKKIEAKAREVKLFYRKKQNISLGTKFKEGKKLESKVRDNALFLSVVAEFNGENSLKIVNWFFYDFEMLSNLKSDDFKHLTTAVLGDEENSRYKEKIVNLIKNSDTGIYDLKSQKISIDEFINLENKYNLDNQLLKKFLEEASGDDLDNEDTTKVMTIHIQYDENNNVTKFKPFDLSFESEGTQRLLALSAPLILALEKGSTLIIDELDNSLHTTLVEAILKLFNSKETNPNNAQLIFTTHDTNLLNQELFRRDQIWFTEKNIYGASELYSLVEYGKGKTRDDLVLEKNYLDGKFGAVPHIGSLNYEGN